MKTHISLVIVNWNQADLTIETLSSLEGLVINNFLLSVIVVDNASKDDSLLKFELYKKENKNKFSKFIVLKNKVNEGFAEGNNVGIRYALKHNAEYVLLLNNDTTVHKSLIVGLLQTFMDYPNAGCISPKIYFAKGYEFHKNRYDESELGSVIWYAGGVMDWNNIYGSNKGVDEVDNGQYDQVINTEFATGCCVMYPSHVFKSVGLFDPRYYLYLEDVDLSSRIKKSGYQVLYTPYTHLWHKVSQSSGVGSLLNDYFITRNRLLFGYTYAPLRTKLALFRESIRFLLTGRKWQSQGVWDYYLKRFGRGSWK